MKNRAFTLIELLVIVLIIGILAAIALPQYRRAVYKSRMAEVAIRIKAMEQAIDLYTLEKGYPSSGVVDLFDVYSDLASGLTKKENKTCGRDMSNKPSCYASKYAWYGVGCESNRCELMIYFSKTGNPNIATANKDITLIYRAKLLASGWNTGTCLYGGLSEESTDPDGPATCSALPGYTPVIDD